MKSVHYASNYWNEIGNMPSSDWWTGTEDDCVGFEFRSVYKYDTRTLCGIKPEAFNKGLVTFLPGSAAAEHRVTYEVSCDACVLMYMTLRSMLGDF